MALSKTVPFITAALVSLTAGTALPQNSDVAPIPEVVSAIKAEIDRVRSTETGAPRLRVDRVIVELITVSSKAGGGKVEVKLGNIGVGAGMDRSYERSRTIVLSLRPLQPPVVGKEKDLGLAEAIRDAKDGARSALSTRPPYATDEIVLEFQTAIERTKKGEISFIVVTPSVTLKDKVTHKIKVFLSVAKG